MNRYHLLGIWESKPDHHSDRFNVDKTGYEGFIYSSSDTNILKQIAKTGEIPGRLTGCMSCNNFQIIDIADEKILEYGAVVDWGRSRKNLLWDENEKNLKERIINERRW